MLRYMPGRKNEIVIVEDVGFYVFDTDCVWGNSRDDNSSKDVSNTVFLTTA